MCIIIEVLLRCFCDRFCCQEKNNNAEDNSCCGKICKFIEDSSLRVHLLIVGVVYSLLFIWTTVCLPIIFGSNMMYDEVGTNFIFFFLFWIPNSFALFLVMWLWKKLAVEEVGIFKLLEEFSEKFPDTVFHGLSSYNLLLMFLPWTMYLLIVYDKDLVERLAGTIKVEDARAIAEANKFVEPFFVFKNGYIDEEPDACYQNMYYKAEPGCRWCCDYPSYDRICPIVPSEQANITCEDIVGWYGYNFYNGSISTFGYRYSPNCDDGFCVSGEIIHHSLPTLKEEKGEHTHKSIYHDCNTMSELLLYKSLAKRFIDETPMKFISRCLWFAFNFLFVVVGSYFLV